MATGAQGAQSAAAKADIAAEQAEHDAQDARDEANAKAAAAAQAEAEAATSERKPVKGGYVVRVDAITLRYGEKSGEVSAFGKGALVHPDAKFVDIDRLVALKALAPNDGKAVRRTTAQQLAVAAGGPLDPVKLPISTVLPENATASQIEEASK